MANYILIDTGKDRGFNDDVIDNKEMSEGDASKLNEECAIEGINQRWVLAPLDKNGNPQT